MAKKSTNKTQHVMNLLSKPATDDAQTTTQGNLLVNSKDEDPVAGIVNDKLEELFENPEGTISEVTEDIVEEETIEIEPEEITPPTQPELAINDQLIASFENSLNSMDNESVIIEEPNVPQINNITDFVQEDFDGEKATNSTNISEEEYVCVNVAEEVVKETAIEVMAKFNVCNCVKCKNDLYAIALNSLPPKYVATHKGQLYAKLNAYGTQNSTDILSAVTKACIKIKASPRH